MKQIRKNCFETNSSSTHSLIIKSDVTVDTIKDEICGIEFELGVFGWGTEIYRDTHTKASYLFTYCHINGLPVDFISEVLDRYGIDYTFRSGSELEPYEDFYIDHQSVDYAEEIYKYTKESESNLLNYLFNTDFELIISNDNGGEDDLAECDPEKFANAEYLCDVDGIKNSAIDVISNKIINSKIPKDKKIIPGTKYPCYLYSEGELDYIKGTGSVTGVYRTWSEVLQDNVIEEDIFESDWRLKNFMKGGYDDAVCCKIEASFDNGETRKFFETRNYRNNYLEARDFIGVSVSEEEYISLDDSGCVEKLFDEVYRKYEDYDYR